MTWHWPICFSLLAAGALPAASLSGQVRPAGVVVWLETAVPFNGPPRVRRARMAQEGKRFLPHVLAIQVGAEVDFANLYTIFHSAFSNFSGQIFDLGLYAPGTSRTVAFHRPGVVRVFCNIHPAMSGVIVVLPSPYFDVSKSSGAFAIAEVPPGDYELHVFHERATESTLRALVRPIHIPPEGVRLPLLTVPETGYVEVPHKNKYGRDYPSPSTTYPHD